MVLSPNNTKPPDEGDNITTNTQHSGSPLNVSRRPTKVLYSKIHQRPAKTRESLIHTKPIVTSALPSSDIISRSSNENSPTIIDTVYWGVSQTPGSLFFDITSRKESDRAIYKLAKSQFLDYVDLVVHKSGSSRYLEINFDKDQIRSKALEDGFHFDNGQTIIRPVLACRPGSTIRRLTLQRLPWLRPQQLLQGLKHTLSNYGYVWDVGIVTDFDTGTLLGSGYAVLDCTTDPSQPTPFWICLTFCLGLIHINPWQTNTPSRFMYTGRKCPHIASIVMNPGTALLSVNKLLVTREYVIAVMNPVIFGFNVPIRFHQPRDLEAPISPNITYLYWNIRLLTLLRQSRLLIVRPL